MQMEVLRRLSRADVPNHPSVKMSGDSKRLPVNPFSRLAVNPRQHQRHDALAPACPPRNTRAHSPFSSRAACARVCAGAPACLSALASATGDTPAHRFHSSPLLANVTPACSLCSLPLCLAPSSSSGSSPLCSPLLPARAAPAHPSAYLR